MCRSFLCAGIEQKTLKITQKSAEMVQNLTKSHKNQKKFDFHDIFL